MTAGEPPARSRPSGTRRALGSLLVLALVVVGLFGVGMWQALRIGGDPQPASAAPYPPSPVEGVVVAVNSSGLGNVSGFAIRISGGTTLSFALGALENATEFSPSHVAEHMATSEPVRVFFRLDGTRAVAYRLEDASS
ncbi:MAG TPA: hypothetical protein VFP56_03065 [Candidatus Limnocylindrales bacterium]|nr:hypothetical protein [Candidatus Limnocylindrales bacterium]